MIRILGGPRFATVEVEIYRQTTQLLRLDIAAALSLVQIAATLLMTLAYTRLQARATVPLELRARAANAQPPRGWRARLLVGANLAVLLLLLGAPLLALALRSVTSFAGHGQADAGILPAAGQQPNRLVLLCAAAARAGQHADLRAGRHRAGAAGGRAGGVPAGKRTDDRRSEDNEAARRGQPFWL